jgi:Raf kinase inhibitor-like YbhB/YbcL family protein
MAMTLTSSAFVEGARIPARFTCEGADMSPPLAWSDPPAGARSFALVCSDPDAPVGTWYHWAVFDLPADCRALPEDYPKDPRVGGVRQAVTDFRRTGYGGPCPPKGHGTHHYRFNLMALAVPALDLADRLGCRDVETAAKRHLLAEAMLTGIYSR